MNWFTRLFLKASPASQVISIEAPKSPITSPRNFEGFTKDGYKKNVVVFQCVNMISSAVADIPFIMYRKKGKERIEIDSHPLIDVLNSPNPMQDRESFIFNALGYYCLTGNMYLERVMVGKKTVELYTRSPAQMEILPGSSGLPKEYIFRVGGSKYVFPVDQITGQSDIKHIKTFNPNDNWLGMSPIEAMAYDVDIVNQMNIWNLSLLQNSGRPSGALIYKPDVGSSNLTQIQRETLKKEIEEKFSSARNAGRPMLLDGGFDWKEMSLTPEEMDFLNSKDVSEKDIALGFRVPGQLVGIKDSMTFANFEQARAVFYEDTVIPNAKMFYRGLTNWLLKNEDPNLCIEPDINAIEALNIRKMEKWDKISNANFLTTDEKRAEIGYGVYTPSDKVGSKILVDSGKITLEMATDDSFEPLEPTEEEEEETEEDSKILKKKISFIDGKQFNLTSRSSRRRYVLQSQRKRNRFEKIVAAGFKRAFNLQKKTMLELVRQGSVSTYERQITKALEMTAGYFMEVYMKEVRTVMVEFAKDIFSLRKSYILQKQGANELWFDSFMRQYIEKQTARKIKLIERTTYKRVIGRVKNIVEESVTGLEAEGLGVIAKAIEDVYDEFTPARSMVIARTEVHNAANQSSLKAVEALDLPNMTKEWLTTMDSRTRGDHAEMNGEIVPFDENFDVPDEKDGTIQMSGPGDPTAPGHQVINCRCTMIFSQEADSE